MFNAPNVILSILDGRPVLSSINGTDPNKNAFVGQTTALLTEKRDGVFDEFVPLLYANRSKDPKLDYSLIPYDSYYKSIIFDKLNNNAEYQGEDGNKYLVGAMSRRAR